MDNAAGPPGAEPGVSIEELPVPAAGGAAGGTHRPGLPPDFLAWHELGNLCEAALWGTDDHRLTVRERLEECADSSYRSFVHLLARTDGRIAGRGTLHLPLQDNTRLAELAIDVHPSFRRRGIGSALLRRLEEAAAGAGRTSLTGFSGHPVSGSDAGTAGMLSAAEGNGAVPAAAPGTAFALRHGYRLAQVETLSRLELPGDLQAVRALLAAARTKAATNYDLVTWGSRCPQEYAGQYAELRRSISVEAPAGEADYTEEAWTVDRVQEEEDRAVRAGYATLVCVAREVSSGTLAGHTFVQRNADKPEVVYQQDTLVLPLHRGRSLGLLMKAANHLRLVREWPGAQRLYTWNASENGPMLHINTALGFRPVAYEGCWQKKA